MFRQKRSRDDGSHAARPEPAGDCDEKVYEENNEVTHFEDIVTNLSAATNLDNY